MRIRNTSSRLARRTSTDAALDAVARRPRPRSRRRRRCRPGAGRRAARCERRRPRACSTMPSCSSASKPQLDDLARRRACRSAARGEPSATMRAAVHDHEPVAELLGLVHVVRREHERHALLLQPVEPVPEQWRACGSSPVVGSSSSSSSGWLISARAIVSRRFMPPESGSTRASRRSVELHELEQLVGALADLCDAAGRSSARRS